MADTPPNSAQTLQQHCWTYDNTNSIQEQTSSRRCPDDHPGAINGLTPASVVGASRLVRTGQVCSLAAEKRLGRPGWERPITRPKRGERPKGGIGTWRPLSSPTGGEASDFDLGAAADAPGASVGLTGADERDGGGMGQIWIERPKVGGRQRHSILCPADERGGKKGGDHQRPCRWSCPGHGESM